MKATTLQQALAHIYWLGGSPCAGKSSVAAALAEKYGWQLYRCDEAYERHIPIITPEHQPTFSRLSTLSGDTLWMRPVAQQLAEEIQLYEEEFPLILADLLALPKTVSVLVEGNALLPQLLAPLLTVPHQAIWMVPTLEFQITYYQQRAWAQEVIAACTDPAQAFANWMQRDTSFAAYITQTTLEQGLALMHINGSHSLEDTINMIDQHFYAYLPIDTFPPVPKEHNAYPVTD